MTKPFFSIIVPALNEEKYLPHLLVDLSKQTLRDFEVIIVDGHSEDKTVEKANKLAPKLPSLRIINSEIRHVCTQRNLGASKAKANTLIFMDADNRLPPYFLQGIKYRLESTHADILTTWFKPDSTNPSHITIAAAMNISFELQNAFSYSFMLESMIIISKKAFNRIGGFDTSINYAEGIPLIKQANKLGLTTITVKDPTYRYSFRRFKKYGAIKMISKTSRLALISLFGKNYRNNIAPTLYPMKGGSQYNSLDQSKRTRQYLQALVDKIEELFQETS